MSLEGHNIETREWKPANILDAALAGRVLMSIPGVHGAEVFGSISRNAEGNDLDLILIVDDNLSQGFFKLVNEKMATKHLGVFRRGRARTRMSAAIEVLGGELEQSIREMNDSKPDIRFDIFLFPADWRERADELQTMMPNSNPMFMRNLSRDAVRLC